MGFNIVIPARLESTRLPGKVLKKIGSMTMLQHVYELAMQAGAETVCIATDSVEIEAVAEKFGASVCMTSECHPSGTQRIAEAVEALEMDPDEVVLCLQADEPQMPIPVIRAVANDLLENDLIKVSTPCCKIQSAEELFDPSVVKVMRNHRGYATYFSRAPIPWDRDHFVLGEIPESLRTDYFRHIGLYGYRVDFLKKYATWGPSPNEDIEKLEQLRIIWNGGKIHLVVLDKCVKAGVDTMTDLARVKKEMK